MKNLTAVIFSLSLLTNCILAKADTEVNFSGVLVEQPCTISSEDEQIDIDLGAVVDKYLYSHQRSSGVPFSLHLLDCNLSIGKAVRIKFEGTPDSLQPGFLKLLPMDENSAQGVAVGIETDSSVFIPIGDWTAFTTLNPNENTINLQVFISAERGAIAKKEIKPGSIASDAIFFLDYQ